MEDRHFHLPAVIEKYRSLARIYGTLEKALEKLQQTATDPVLLSVLEIIRILGGKIGRSFLALKDLIGNHPATKEAEFVAHFYFMNYSIISENARAGERIISYVVAHPVWLAEHSVRIIESLKTLYADLITLEIECKERFRLAYNRHLGFDFIYRDGEQREWGGEVMSIEEAFAFLGLPIHAGHEEVKSAFRKLAKLHHPDINPDARRDDFIKLERAYRRALTIVNMPM
jgi:hypothetical protein